MRKASLIATAFLMMTLATTAALAAGIGYDMREEKQDGPTHTYTVTFDVWSEDRAADELSVNPKTEATNIQIKTKKLVWHKVPKGKHQSASVVVVNASQETGSVQLLIVRKAGNRKDTNSIQIQVAPQ